MFQVANTTLTAGAHATYPFDGTSYDDVNQYDGAGTITLERSGLYAVHAGISRGTTGGTSNPLLSVLRSGSLLLEVKAAAQNGAISAIGSDIVELDAGDTITATITLDAAASRTLVGGKTFLTVVRVGPIRYVGN